MTSIEILVQSGRFKTVEDILQNIDLVTDMLREDVAKTLAKAGITATSLDDYYTEAVRKIRHNLERKRHLKGIKKLLSCQNVETGLKILLSKLRGYTHNHMLQHRKNSVAYYKKKYKNEVEAMDTTSDPFELLLQEEAEKEEKNRRKQAKKEEIEKIAKMVQRGEIKASRTGCGHTQLCFNF